MTENDNEARATRLSELVGAAAAVAGTRLLRVGGSTSQQVAHNRQYALPVGGLRGWAITDLRGAHNDAAGSSTTHLPASENRHYRMLS
jgi:hypothetical protein